MNVQWYPGHMTKAKRQMQEDLKLIDLIIELVDARVPLSSRNPDIDQLGQNKSRLILLNKADLADERQNEAWKEYFQKKGFHVVKVDSRNGSGMKTIQNVIQEACREKIERDRRRGIKNRPIRAMVAGIPNVGKSTFINTFAGKACAKTGNRPGVTKGKQWIRLNKNVELLDTPGILWPKFEDQQVGIRLACVGSIKDDILNMEELALWLIEHLRTNYSGLLEKRYGISEEGTAVEIPGKIARARGCLKKGEELAQDCNTDLDAITNIYNYVIENITYDEKKAASVPYGYIPVPDDTLSSGRGICFDYASLMSAMLRSQRIPTKLDVGYSGDVYHAWISCYVTEVGWVDNIIEFDGKSWSIMDPTLAASNSASNVKKYVGDGSNYVTKYTY